MNFMEEINNDTSVFAAVRSSFFSHLLNLEKFDFYFILRLLQRLFGIIYPIHVKCQSRQATTGDLNDWIQELASALTTDLNTFGKRAFCGMQRTSAAHENKLACYSSSASCFH